MTVSAAGGRPLPGGPPGGCSHQRPHIHPADSARRTASGTLTKRKVGPFVMPPIPRPGDEMTIGELGRRMDEMRGDVRELSTYMREHVEQLPTNYVPRAELAVRDSAVDGRLAGVETEVAVLKRDQVSTLRQVVLAAAAAAAGALPGFIAIAHH